LSSPWPLKKHPGYFTAAVNLTALFWTIEQDLSDPLGIAEKNQLGTAGLLTVEKKRYLFFDFLDRYGPYLIHLILR
jgi:hypothetical protein